MSAQSASRAPSLPALLLRIGAAVLGGYSFVWGFTCLVVALGLRAQMPYGEAQTLAFLLAFLVFLVAFLWTFAVPSVLKAWSVLAGGGVLMTGAAWVLVNHLP